MKETQNRFSKFQNKCIFKFYILRNSFSKWKKERIFKNLKIDTQNTTKNEIKTQN